MMTGEKNSVFLTIWFDMNILFVYIYVLYILYQGCVQQRAP